MNCCEKCFSDVEVVDIIRNNRTKGSCDFCGNKNIYVYDINNDSTLSDMFSELLSIYTAVSELPSAFPREKTDLLKNVFYRNWSVFNVTPECIYRLLTEICREKYSDQPELFDSPVGILESQDRNYLDEFSILRNYQWQDFVGDIKTVNRFHTDHINKDVLNLFLRCARKSYKAGTVLYRARICSGETRFAPKEMGAPPVGSASPGRINPNGISILYLADSVKTTLHETRAGIYDYVTVGSFRLKRDAEVVNFAALDKISPFIANTVMGIEYTQHAINIGNLKLMSQEMAKPLRRQDSVLDYLPTQYISDYIKSRGFDGVEFISTMHDGGANLAVFDSSIFKCTKANLYRIKSMSYDEELIRV